MMGRKSSKKTWALIRPQQLFSQESLAVLEIPSDPKENTLKTPLKANSTLWIS
jgi:hypothetical protein